MKIFSENENYKLYQGNMLDMLEVIQPNSVDSIVCDPPYELNFMGKGWDNSGIAFQKETWQKCFEVLKDGGYLLAFGGSRTFHRIACAIEDAGFEIRDTIMWLYGSGFPKSMNIGLAIDKKNGIESKVIGERSGAIQKGSINWNGEDRSGGKGSGYKSTFIEKQAMNEWRGWGTCLKPSFEPIIVARKPFKGSLIDNVIENGVGGLNIDECRVETLEKIKPTKRGSGVFSETANGKKTGWNKENYNGDYQPNEQGRFPANTILTYDDTDFDEVCGGFPNTKSTYNKDSKHETIIHRDNKDILKYGYKTRIDSSSYNDSGSASRYFYCAKTSKKDRDEGCQDLEDTYNACSNQAIAELKRGNDTFSDETNSTFNKVYKGKNTHPTVKPTELMQYLIRLVSPNGATILDPFNGSGSTGKAVMYENKERNKNYKYIGIELTEEYLPIAQARIEYVCNLPEEKDPQLTIFDLEENNE